MAQVFPSTRFGPPQHDWLRRVIGTTDINGRGTAHPVERQCDPFILFDEGVLPSGHKPPFGKHPHTGLVACTLLFPHRSNPSSAWDNIRGRYGPVGSGGIYQVRAGRGLVHDEGEEHTDSPDRSPVQHVAQLWFNPGVHLKEEMLDTESEVLLVEREGIPEIRPGDGDEGGISLVRVLLGKYGGRRSAAKTWKAELLLLDVYFTDFLSPGADPSEEAIDLPYQNSWVYVCSTAGGGAEVSADANVAVQVVAGSGPEGGGEESADISILPQHIAILPPGTTSIRFRSSSDTRLSRHVLVGSGTPFNEKWCKLLGHDGAMVGPDEAYVRAKMAEFERNPDKFGMSVE